MTATLYTFKGVNSYGNLTVSDQLKSNLIDFLNWGFLEIGAFVNVRIPNTTIYGGEAPYKLRAVTDPNFTNGRVWESQRVNWVYESGLTCSKQPIYVSGVYVDGSFHPGTGVGQYAHIVDYNNGRVIFNTAIAISSSVTCEYSYKSVSVVDVDSDIFREVQRNSFDNSDTNIPVGSGDWAKQSQSRIQFPYVAVDITPNIKFQPKQLGGGQYKHQDVNFHIVAEKSSQRNKICDIITSQNDRTILLFDSNKIADANAFSLTASGNLNSFGVNNYRNRLLPVESGGFQWKLCELSGAYSRTVPVQNLKLHYGLVGIETKIDMPEI